MVDGDLPLAPRRAAHVDVHLHPEPSSPAAARAAVRALLARHHVDEEQSEVAVLVVSELVTNAVVHAGTPVTVDADLEGGCLRVSVGDGSPEVPVLRDVEPTATSGRGLRIVEQLADRWGIDPGDRGKAVWFELDVGPDEAARAPTAATG